MVAKQIELDLTRDLPKVRAAYKRLIKNIGMCAYTAPCAVGVMMTPAQRRSLQINGADGMSVDVLIDRKKLCVPAEQTKSMIVLQEAFDSGDIRRFNAVLDELERKYLTVSA
jgi:hypothetical protein